MSSIGNGTGGGYVAVETFICLTGQIQNKRERTEILQRPGVDGTGVRRLAVRGTPFVLETLEDFATEALAAAAFDSYTGRIAAGPYTMIKDTVEYTDVAILEVVKVDSKRHVSIVGGVNGLDGGPAVILRAQWTFVFLEP